MISLTNLTLRRGPRALFEGVTLLINAREKVGIIGDNGCGKSSLFALIMSDLSADQGDIKLQDGIEIAHVAQETPSSDQSALDYVLDGDRVLRETETALANIDHGAETNQAATLYEKMTQVDGYAAPSRAARLLHGLGFKPEQFEASTSSFSGGWRVRLNLARALMCPSDLLLLDEPTNHLDLDAVVWLEDWLKNYPGTLLMISHDRDFLDAICRRIVHIENQRVRAYSGNYSRFETTRAEQMANEQAMYVKQQRAISHMQSYVTRFKAKATKARQAQSRLKALERMEIIAPAHINSPFKFEFFEPARASDPILKLEDAEAGYNNIPILKNVNLSLRSGDRIALVGPNGAGKSTLIKLLAATLSPSKGEITKAKALNIGYFAQHQLEQLDPTATPLQQFSLIYPKTRSQEIRNYLGGFGFHGDKIDEPIGPFSGGEKARLALSILIFGKPNLLLMDEPTNHLDLEMRHALTLAFQNYTGAILLVSHDRHLIRTVTDKLLLVHQGEVSEFDDDIEGYMQWTKTHLNVSSSKRPRSESTQHNHGDDLSDSGLTKKQKRQIAAKLREQVKPLTQKIKRIEQQIERNRKAQEELETTLQDPAVYENESTANLAKMMQKKSDLNKTIEVDENNWFELSEQLELLQSEMKEH